MGEPLAGRFESNQSARGKPEVVHFGDVQSESGQFETRNHEGTIMPDRTLPERFKLSIVDIPTLLPSLT